MKQSKKFLCLLLSVLMAVSVCGGLVTSADAVYSLTERTDKAYDVAIGVHYSEYDITSGVYEGVTVSASALEFNTKEYMVIPYSGVAGGAGVLSKQYELATAEGYDVVGIINGSFFSMDTGNHGNYGYLNEYIVTNGEIVSADNDNPATDFDGMVCIMSDGTAESVSASTLHFSLYLGGTEVPGGVANVNKTSGCNNASNWSNGFYYFDRHSGDTVDETSVSKALTYEICPGYEVLCRKLNGTKLTIGGTLEAEVISVTENTYGGEIGEDEFILFVKTASPYASYVSSLKAGDPVAISASETSAAAGDVTANATSIIANVGYLVKDGVNLVADSSFNDGAAHSNTTKARWSAFGIKDDGTWVFFTTEGASTGKNGSVTLQDVAQAMIGMGCTTVIRLDGGGSSALYVCDDGTGKAGYKQSSTRAVGDCLLVVKRTSEALQVSETLAGDVASLVAEAEAKKDDAYVASALAFANEVTANTNAVAGDYQLAYMKLRYALSGKNELGALLRSVAGITYTDYSEYVLGNLRAAYAKASALFGSSATAEEIAAAYEELKTWYDRSGTVTLDGTEYTPVENGAYLTGLNLNILTDYCSIYTPGTDVSGVNLNWSNVMLVRWNEEAGAYLVEQNFQAPGQLKTILSKLNFEGNIVPEDCLVIGTHGDSGAGKANKTLVASVKVGSKLLLYGVDLENMTVGVGAYFTFEAVEPAYLPGDVSGDGEVNLQDYMLVRLALLQKIELDADETACADVVADGIITLQDAMLIRSAILGKIEL